ncbi:AAA family ATPase [Sulfurimonas sp.]|uniref:AAA family ATPase n=1 Tax=Sulfurimonas sp. TaxID=2022749 RepID=UPI00356B0473
MELVYLWVEDYKNIKQQGFNFSPRFECKYDEKTKVLTIDEKEHIEDFFGKNINVTAIVGENGSGKSSILSCIPARKKAFIVIFDQELKVYTRNIRVVSSLKPERLTSTFYKNILYYSMDHKYLRDTNRSINHIVLENTNQLITENYSKLNELNFNLFDFKPYYIYYELNDLKLVNDNDEITDNQMYSIKSSLGRDSSFDSGIILDTIRAIESIEDEYLIYLLSQFGSLSELFENIDLTEKLDPKHGYLHINNDEIQSELKDCEIPFLSEYDFKLLKDNETQKIKIEELESILGDRYNKMLFDDMHDELDINYYSLNGATFNSLSHGEKTIYSFLLNIVHSNQNEYLLFLDEPDNTLHPEWQKRFLNELIHIIKKLDKKVHIVTTTHSPFLLSDVSKENVVFLEKNKDTGECINVTKMVNINPFGTNIHTLLSHGFFMQEGLMGEFAKSKINEILEFHKEVQTKDADIKTLKSEYENKQKRFWQTQSIMGEDYLKQVIKNHLVEIEKTLDKDRYLDNEIERAKIELQKLEAIKDAKNTI